MDIRKTDLLNRAGDKVYKCTKCGRENTPGDTLMKDGKPECLWSCFPYINTIQGHYRELPDRRQE
jgi:predicted  nucleic acid-binding Zn-ribbon protein